MAASAQVARGCVYPGFKYETLEGAVVAPIRFRADGLSGTGDQDDSWETCRDYVNGGPLFALPGHSPVEPESWQAIEKTFPGLKVLLSPLSAHPFWQNPLLCR